MRLWFVCPKQTLIVISAQDYSLCSGNKWRQSDNATDVCLDVGVCVRARVLDPYTRAHVCILHHLFVVLNPTKAARTRTHAALGNSWLFEEWSCADLFQSDYFDPAAPLQPVTDHPNAQSDREREISLAEWRHSNSAICIMNFKLLNPRPALFLRFVPLSSLVCFFPFFFFFYHSSLQPTDNRTSLREDGALMFLSASCRMRESFNCASLRRVNAPHLLPLHPLLMCAFSLRPSDHRPPLLFSTHSAFFLLQLL